MKKIKLFTHTDLDGIGCATLATYMFFYINDNQIEISYCTYDNINKIVDEFISQDIKTINDYELCFITDVSVSDEIANKIDYLMKNGSTCEFILLDHHVTALDLNKYLWCDISINNIEGLQTCGTEMLFNYFVSNSYFDFNIKDLEMIKQFAEIVRDYDTYRWKETNNIECKKVNDLYYMYGKEKFISWCVEQFYLGHAFPYFTETDKALLDNKQNEIDKYIEQKNKEMILNGLTIESKNYMCGFVFADKFVSELGNKLCELNESLIDFVTIIDISSGKINFRTIKNDVNLGEIASKFGGGGHAKASGMSFESKCIKLDVIKEIFGRSVF